MEAVKVDWGRVEAVDGTSSDKHLHPWPTPARVDCDILTSPMGIWSWPGAGKGRSQIPLEGGL